MKNKLKIRLLCLILFSSLCWGFIGLRAGIGQFVPLDSTFEDTYANSYLFEGRFSFHEPIFIQAGTKLINVHNASIPIITDPSISAPLTLGAYKHRLDAIGIYGGIGLGFELGNGGTGLFPYISADIGLISPLISQRIEYYMDGDTSATIYKVQQERHWAYMASLSAGLEVRVIGIGIFIEGDYMKGRAVDYDAITIDGIELFPGGTIETNGWSIFVGVSID
ncbi:hypothetical protein KAH81_07890 [bacterium]|nr:hypothetical protein [bacterium]